MPAWWAGLPAPSDATLAAITDRFDEPWRRLKEILDGHTGWLDGPRSVPRWHEIADWLPEDIRTAALALHTLGCGSQPQRSYLHAALVRDLVKRADGWTREELAYALYTAASAKSGGTAALEAPIGIAARLEPGAWPDLRPFLQRILDWLLCEVGADERRLTTVLGDLIDEAAGLPRSLIGSDDYGSAARRALAHPLSRAGIGPLLAHCSRADRPVPAKRWFAELDRLVAAAPTAVDMAQRALDLFVAAPQYVHANNDRLLRGLVWILVDDDVERLSMFAVAASATDPGSTGYPYAPAAAASALIRLGRSRDDTAVKTLARLSLTVKNKALNARVQAALSELGALRGWSPSEVLELAVDDHGLAPDGTLTRVLGDYVATVQTDEGKVRLSFGRGDKALKGVPAAVKEQHANELTRLKKLVKEIDITLVRERARVEGLLSEEREWPYADWVARMLAHPLTGTFGRRLIYETTVDRTLWTAGLPVEREGGWGLATLDGGVVAGDRVRLWHPIRAGIDEVTAWRDHVAAIDLRQPFRQAFREVYLLTPAEVQTEAYSNRFAAHILRYRQANALMRVRGWSANYLGTWDGGYAATATKVLGGGLWRASFHHELVAQNDRYEAELCSTDQVRFERRDGAVWERVRVPDVPPVVLSEAMRDVDLFVGVTSVAADPAWIDRGAGHTEYWRSAAFGALTASAEVRRDALVQLLPRTKIARQVELDGNYLRVRGRLRTYRIHLGSGNILMDPNDAYLCIVAARGKSSALRLPFEDDAMLSMILSKAFLLAADDKITDESILRQINRG